MTKIFLFYLGCVLKNQIFSWFRRLKQPKYLVSGLVGLGYFYLMFFRQFFSRPRRPVSLPAALDLNMVPILEAAFTMILFAIVLLPWLWPSRGGYALKFTEAEIQFFFPAPLSRRALINFRLAKMQLGVLFGVLVSFLVFGRARYLEHPQYSFVTLWIIYSFLALYYVGTALTTTSLAEHGTSGLRRHVWALAIVASLVVSVAVWAKWFFPSPPDFKASGVDSLVDWLVKITESGPALYVLYPFKVLVRPAFSPDGAAFLLRLIPALAILGFAYFWVMRADVSFEEASLERARKMAALLEVAKSGGWKRTRRPTAKVRRPMFNLSPTGFAATAIFWKNTISLGRLGSLRVLPAVVVIAVGMTAIFASRSHQGNWVPTIVGSVAGTMAAFLTLIGPNLVRDDLRCDLLQIDLLKSYPVSGWGVVLAEIMAPVATLALWQWILLLIAILTLPDIGKTHLTLSLRILLGSSAAFLFPCFSLIGVLIQNAAALIMPGWVRLGKERVRGIEAMGQNIITMTATVLIMALTLIPAGLIFTVVFLPAYLAGYGLAALPVASLLAALGLLAEAGIAIFWLGRLYDQFDVSLESPGS